MEFKTDDGIVHAVDDVTFDLFPNETLGIVGESGSGSRSRRWRSSGSCPTTAKITGEVLFGGENLVGKSEKELRPYRGDRIAMIFQDALASLNPVYKVGDQIAEAIKVHSDVSGDELREQVIELLDLVGIPNPRPARRPVPARVLGRHAPAGHDRDVDRERSRRADRRRADHRARRHDPGPGARRARSASRNARTPRSFSSRTTSASSRASPIVCS